MMTPMKMRRDQRQREGSDPPAATVAWAILGLSAVLLMLAFIAEAFV